MILKKTPLRYRENAKFRRLENGNGRKQYIIHNNILLYLYRYMFVTIFGRPPFRRNCSKLPEAGNKCPLVGLV